MLYKELKFGSEAVFLITGVAGFIGSNIAEAILTMGYKVRGLDNFSNGKRSNVEVLNKHEKFEFVEGDIRDVVTCDEVCKGVTYVLHQAALGSVPRSMELPLIYEDNNVKGTSNMMDSAYKNGVKRFVYASSSSVYGDSRELPKREGKEGNILSPYALTKSVNESYGKMYTEVYGLGCIGLRYFNVFGKRQDPYSQYSAVIPKFLNLLLDDKEVMIYGDGEQSRDFTYIENVIEANLKACLAGENACGSAYNIAFGEQFTVNRMYQLMLSEVGMKKEAIYHEERVGDIRHSLADISEARAKLGYNPQWNFEQGFKMAVDWYLNELQGAEGVE